MIGRTAPLKAQIAILERQLEDRKSMDAKMFAANVQLSREVTDLRRQLAVFTAPRQRGPRGRFLSTKEQVA
jgi:regulator of replication initiation timing